MAKKSVASLQTGAKRLSKDIKKSYSPSKVDSFLAKK